MAGDYLLIFDKKIVKVHNLQTTKKISQKKFIIKNKKNVKIEPLNSNMGVPQTPCPPK